MQSGISPKSFGNRAFFHPGLRRPFWGSIALLLVSVSAAWSDDWPGWLGPQRDGIWRETGILERFPPEGPPIRWRTKIAAGYAGPAVADGRVYVTDRVVAEG